MNKYIKHEKDEIFKIDHKFYDKIGGRTECQKKSHDYQLRVFFSINGIT